MDMNTIAILGRLAGEKAAESFLLPPRKVTPSTREVKPKPGQPQDFDEEPRASQLPHRYGSTRPVKRQ